MKIRGEWRYLYRAIDKHGVPVDFLLTAKRDLAAAKRFFRKALIAGVVICLLALQGIALGGPRHERHVIQASADAAVLAYSGDEICHPGAPANDDERLNHERRHHSHCCVFCIASNRDAPAFAAALIISFSTFIDSGAETTVTHPIIDEEDGHLIGWASSWSSRAPPLFA